MLFVHQVAHHHFKGLHRHIDAGVEKHKCNQAKHQSERAGVGQQAHHHHRHEGAHKQVGNAAAEATPSFVAKVAHQRLHEHTHERWKNPKETQIVRVCSKGGKYTADVGTLQRVGNLHTKETETDVKQFPKT